MIIKDITDIYSGKRIKLGASDGSGFIFCGEVPAADTFDEIMSQTTDMYQKAYIDSFNKIYYESIEVLRDIFNRHQDREISKRIKAGWDDEKKEEVRNKLEAKLKSEEEFLKFKKRRDKAIERARFRLDNFSPFIEREIVKVYNSGFPGNEEEIIVIFSGFDNGDYWTDEEYKKGVK